MNHLLNAPLTAIGLQPRKRMRFQSENLPTAFGRFLPVIQGRNRLCIQPIELLMRVMCIRADRPFPKEGRSSMA
jgi:hypothetical protein